MFPMDNFHFPLVTPVSIAAAIATTFSSLPSLALLHSCLSHAFSWVQQLTFRDLLGFVSKDNFDCTSC